MPVSLSIDGGVATVTLDRPEKKNALGKAMQEELPRLFERIQDDVTIRAAVLTGGGTDFCAGADVREMGGGGIADSMVRVALLHRMMRGLLYTPKPVLAAVRGVCIGVGWSIALACDYVVAAADTRFQFAFRHVGLAPDGGAVHLLTRNLGPIRAKELIFSGRFVSGDEARSLGLVTEIAPGNNVLARAQAIAHDLAAAPTLALTLAKRQFTAAETQSYEEALAAFKAKRKAEFKGQ
jgi:2-(1,2-epoxy-1,2-dihydrophenyl)acetyl-CoA isomerase